MSSGLSESAPATAEKEAVDDAIMDDETDKMKRAARQSKRLLDLKKKNLLTYLDFIVEFYFADSNLPFDR